MKFVHIADIHLDSPFTLLSDKANLGEQRRLEQRLAIKEVIQYIKENNIECLFIAGDLYEQNYIRKTTIEYINNLFKEIPNTKIFITPGNHDPFIKNSYYNTFKWNENVKIFNSKIEKIELEDINIYGYGFNDFYCENSYIENLEIENKEKINILIMHADLDASKFNELQYNSINTKILEEKGFDYIALGHIHKNNFNKENNIIYPGSLISLGFDELGEHGMIIGEIEKNNIKLNFKKIDKKEFCELELNCTEINSIEELIEKVNNLNLEENKLYKIILIGTRNFEINIYDIYKYELNNKIIKIKNNTRIKYNLENMENNTTLKGLFIKEIINELKNNPENKEIIENALEIGIESLL